MFCKRGAASWESWTTNLDSYSAYMDGANRHMQLKLGSLSKHRLYVILRDGGFFFWLSHIHNYQIGSWPTLSCEQATLNAWWSRYGGAERQSPCLFIAQISRGRFFVEHGFRSHESQQRLSAKLRGRRLPPNNPKLNQAVILRTQRNRCRVDIIVSTSNHISRPRSTTGASP